MMPMMPTHIVSVFDSQGKQVCVVVFRNATDEDLAPFFKILREELQVRRATGQSMDDPEDIITLIGGRCELLGADARIYPANTYFRREVL